MKKWIIIMGVLVCLIILLLIQSDGRKMVHTEMTRMPGPHTDTLSANTAIAKHKRFSITFSFHFTRTAD